MIRSLIVGWFELKHCGASKLHVAFHCRVVCTSSFSKLIGRNLVLLTDYVTIDVTLYSQYYIVFVQVDTVSLSG